MRKLLICPFFGALPSWWDEYEAQLPHLEEIGYDILLDFDLDRFKQRVTDKLDVDCPITLGSPKIHDYRAAFGVLYADEASGYEWYGTTDFDCVYGRIDRFVTPEKLDRCAIYSDCQYQYISGPFSLYRNEPRVNELFSHHEHWVEILEITRATGWVETDFSEIARNEVEVLIENNHGFGNPNALHRASDGTLTLRGEEISHFHFNRTKEWPL